MSLSLSHHPHLWSRERHLDGHSDSQRMRRHGAQPSWGVRRELLQGYTGWQAWDEWILEASQSDLLLNRNPVHGPVFATGEEPFDDVGLPSINAPPLAYRVAGQPGTGPPPGSLRLGHR